MTVLWITLAILLSLAGWIALGLTSYALFHPYVDTLKQKVLLSIFALPVLFAMLLPMLRSEGPAMVPAYFAGFAVFFALSTVLFHFIERKYRHV
jgi:hypothetical protein